jgi:hypothetical protein
MALKVYGGLTMLHDCGYNQPENRCGACRNIPELPARVLVGDLEPARVRSAAGSAWHSVQNRSQGERVFPPHSGRIIKHAAWICCAQIGHAPLTT